MHIPGDVLIGFIEEGNVYLLQNPTFEDKEKPHFHVVVNKNPDEDAVIILVYATSQVEKQKRWAKDRKLPKETLVITDQNECTFLKQETLFNCNNRQLLTKDDMRDLTDNAKLKYIDKVPKNLLSKLREGLLKSPVVEKDIKEMLKN